MSDIPAFVETEPDRFKPTEECTREELIAAAEAMMAHAVMGMREAVEEAGARGMSPVAKDLHTQSNNNMDSGRALLDFAAQDWADDPEA